MTLIDSIVERGVDFVKEMPEGIRKDKEAVGCIFWKRITIQLLSTIWISFFRIGVLLKMSLIVSSWIDIWRSKVRWHWKLYPSPD